MFITKSQVVAGAQCLKRLYLIVHEPDSSSDIDDSAQAIIEQGREVGLLARKLFPGGVVVESRDPEQAIRRTQELIANPRVPAIFEGAFEYRGVFVRVDILQRRRDRRWRLIEVKSTADLKDHHLNDVAIQHRVVKRSGLDLASTCLAHVNRSYVFDGGEIDVHRFFRMRNLTRRIEKSLPKLALLLGREFRILALPEVPQVSVGAHCTHPVTCEFYDRCNPALPEHHVLTLPRISASAVDDLDKLGIRSILDIPDDFPLSDRIRRACTAVQKGKAWFSAELRDELRTLKYPLCFMDFETVNPAIPRFAGMRPYDHIPFQWSVHVQREPGGSLDHHEFLAMDSSDPRSAFISSLCDALGGRGSIVTYNQTFESQRLSELGAWLPNYAKRIENIQQRLWDLLPLVRKHVYHPAFGGSYSLKAVLPALVPELIYEGMEVPDGQAAGVAWNALTSGGCTEPERQQKRKALLQYCRQDTVALVRLFDVFFKSELSTKSN
jgi:predicted RecB family nuclease